MANLTRTWSWEKWVPPLGDNPGNKPFYLELASGLTKEQLSGFQDGFSKAMEPPPEVEGDRWRAWAEQLAGAFGHAVRLGAEPLRLVDEQGAVAFEVKALADFFLLLLQGPRTVLFELSRALVTYNTLGGQVELFYARHSGGTGTTPAPSVVKDEGQTGGP